MAESARSQLSTLEGQIDSVGLLSWGSNSYGQLGQGHKEDQKTAQEVQRSKVTTGIQTLITGGGGHTLAITGDGQLWTCGSSSHGQLGLGGREDVRVMTSVPFPSPPVKVTQVCGGWDFTLACTEHGALYSWGNNAFLQLGRDLGSAEKCATVPGKVELPSDRPVVCVAAGLRHGLAVTAGGEVFGWGQNKKGQVGEVRDASGNLEKAVPHPVQLTISSMDKVLQITAGAYHSGALTNSGDIYLWGCNKFGQLSTSPSEVPHSPHPRCLSSPAFGGQQVRAIRSGWTHCLALTDTGQVFSWGRADYGQLGRSCDRPCDPTPKRVAGVEDARQVVCGSEHNLCLTGEGRLLCWGWNEHGICGTGDESNVLLPTQVALPAAGVLSIGCGAGHSFAFVKR